MVDGVETAQLAPTVSAPVAEVLPNTRVWPVILLRDVELRFSVLLPRRLIVVDAVLGAIVTVWPDAVTAPFSATAFAVSVIGPAPLVFSVPVVAVVVMPLALLVASVIPPDRLVVRPLVPVTVLMVSALAPLFRFTIPVFPASVPILLFVFVSV